MKKVGGAILRAVVIILLVGGIGFLVTNGIRLFDEHNSMQKEAKERMVRRCGPICQTDQLGMDAYRWLNGPWPWELCERGEG